MERITDITLLNGKWKDEKENIIEFDSYGRMKYNGEVLIEHSAEQLRDYFFMTKKLGRVEILKIDDEKMRINILFDGAPSDVIEKMNFVKEKS